MSQVQDNQCSQASGSSLWHDQNSSPRRLASNEMPSEGTDADEDDCDLLELGVDVETGPGLVPGVPEVPGDNSSLVDPVDFLLDFLLETRFLLSMSESLMLC